MSRVILMIVFHHEENIAVTYSGTASRRTDDEVRPHEFWSDGKPRDHRRPSRDGWLFGAMATGTFNHGNWVCLKMLG